jgi:hypothetical protein
MAEWLRRWPAKPMCNACVGSNPTSVDLFLLLFQFFMFGRFLPSVWQGNLRANATFHCFVQTLEEMYVSISLLMNGCHPEKAIL